MLVNISLEEAQTQILNSTRYLPAETISIIEAVGRVSAMEVVAETDLPAYDQSAVDGYAVAYEGDEGAGRYELTGRLLLGDVSRTPLDPGQAIGVVTGGFLPDGTQTVIPHEKVEICNQFLCSLETVKPGNNIKKAGEDYARGSRLVARGSVLSPGHIGLLSAFGISSIAVCQKPQVAVLCLSRHVVPWNISPQPGQIRDSNGPLLSALVRQDGGSVVSIQAAGNNASDLKELGLRLLDQSDILIISGGTYAVGANEACCLMKELGADLLYWDVPIQPGSHTGAAVAKSKLLFALSGNPAGCAVGYHLFVAPAIHMMQGMTPRFERRLVRCSNGFAKKSGSRRFIRGCVGFDETGLHVAVLPRQKPSMIGSLVNCNALIDVPAGSPPVETGQFVSILMLKSTVEL